MKALLKVDQLVVRSIYEALRKHIIEHGYLPDTANYANNVNGYLAARQNIITHKKFCIDIYSQSSQRFKDFKGQPRMVIFLQRVYDGEIGFPQTMVTRTTAPGEVAAYSQGIMPGKTANLIVAVHLLSITSEQTYTLNAILSNVLGQRIFLPYYNNPTERFLVEQTNYSEIDNPIENYNESAYFFTIKDARLSEPEEVRTFPGLQSITAEIQLNTMPVEIIDVEPENPGNPGNPDPGTGEGINPDDIVNNEIPNGLINGSNAIFTTDYPFIPESVSITVNGMEMALEDDYNILSANSFQFMFSPEPGEKILIDYIKA